MKILSRFKILNLIALLIILNIKVFGQNPSFIPDVKKDSIWIAQSILTANKLHPAYRDTNGIGHEEWMSGKVLYSTDGSLKATQLTAGPGTFITTIQFSYHGKVFQQGLNYNADFSNYTLNSIHKLPGDKPAYLFLLSSIEDTTGYEHDWLADFKTSDIPADTDFNHIKTVAYIATAFRLEKDSLFETTFPLTTSQAADTASLDGSKSYGFRSDVKHSAKSPKPFLKYDPVTHLLEFFNYSKKVSDNDIDAEWSLVNVESGSFRYKDTSFVLANDTSYDYPSLESLTKIIARRNYKAGKYIIKAVATKSYDDFGEGGILPVLIIKYKIGSQTLTCVNDDDYDDGNKVDITPDYRIQNNASLILLLTDETNGHGPGMCGAADYIDSHFWLIDNGKSPQKLFSFSYGSCSSAVTYVFTRNGKEISGFFYIKDPSDDKDISFENSYWKDGSTYVFVFHDQEASSSRNFYLHFNAANKKVPVTLKSGKLYKAKQ